ncbi:MAG: DUF2460 domain-containing protein [Pseudomonadota bacterium]
MPIEVLDYEFPLEISYGTRAGPEHRTVVHDLTSGFVDTVRVWQAPRRRYEVTIGRKKLADLQVLEDFVLTVGGRECGFLIRDPVRSITGGGEVPGAADELLGLGDDAQTTYPLQRSVIAAGKTVAQPISRPDGGSVRVSVAGSELLSGFSLDGLGRVTLLAAPAAGEEVRAGFTYRIPVRLEDDWTPALFDGYRQGQPVTLNMIEVFER